MRKKATVICALLSAILLLFCGCTGSDQAGTTDAGEQGETTMEITSFSFTHRGMSTADCYLYSAAKETDGVRLYTEGLFSGGKIVDVLIETSVMERLGEIVEKHDIHKWNGFDKTDKQALDGTGFTLSIAFADGSSVYANGSNKFPDRYEDAKSEICALFEGLIDQHSEAAQ